MIGLVNDPVVMASLVATAMVVLWAVLLPSGLPYRRWSRRQLRSTACGTRPVDPPEVYWQAGQWDSDLSHVYVANIGHDTAYQVSVTTCDEVVGRTRSVPPYRSDRLTSRSSLPYYVTFAVDQWSKRKVQVSWRSEDNKWFSQTVRAN